MANRDEPVALHETTRERYLNYALSVITSRALPDVRDGLKPVQRRILYGMHQLRLTADARYRKSAQVVGEVMGKYHPHGDTAIYDAMVRMAQPFSLRYTLVDGQGNFGSLDGDGAAAMRYTEARLAPLANEVLADLSDRIVPFRPNYDATLQEPVVLPAALPILLVNGATGIAVGMATNIPPHNLAEVVRASIAVIDDPSISLDALLELMPAPDFPTAGRILNTPAELREIYETGQGAIELRGQFEEESEGRRRRLVITSVPYTVNKAQLVERIADHIRTGKLPQVVDIRDESTEEVRVVLELRSGADPEAAMAYLCKHTPLQSRFHVNITALVPIPEDPTKCRPERIGLRAMLRHFLDFRFEVVTRRLEMQLEDLRRAIHILEGFEIIFDALDEAIAIIRASRDRADAAERLTARFGLDEQQTDAILQMRLYRLARLEIEKIRAELASKRAEAAHIEALLASDAARWRLIRDELEAVGKRFNDARRTIVAGPDQALQYTKEAYILEEDVYVIVTRQGWFKRQRSYSDVSTIRVREGDDVRWAILASTRAAVILFSNRGKAYTLLVDSVPATTGFGEPVQAHFDFEDGEQVIGVCVNDPRSLPELQAPTSPQTALPFADEPDTVAEEVAPTDELRHHLVAVSRAGQTLRLSLEPFEPPSTVAGRLFMRLQPERRGGDAVVGVEVSGGAEIVSLVSHMTRVLTFPVDEVTVLKSAGKGLRAIALDANDHVVGFALARDPHQGVEAETNRGRSIVACPAKFPPVSRGARGKQLIRRGHIANVKLPVVELRPVEEPTPEAADEPTLSGSESPPHGGEPEGNASAHEHASWVGGGQLFGELDEEEQGDSPSRSADDASGGSDDAPDED